MIKHIAYSYQYENQLLSFKNIFTTVVRSILASNTPLTSFIGVQKESKSENVNAVKRGHWYILSFYSLLSRDEVRWVQNVKFTQN